MMEWLYPVSCFITGVLQGFCICIAVQGWIDKRTVMRYATGGIVKNSRLDLAEGCVLPHGVLSHYTPENDREAIIKIQPIDAGKMKEVLDSPKMRQKMNDIMKQGYLKPRHPLNQERRRRKAKETGELEMS